VRLAMQSVADTAIIPVQDMLGLSVAGRMNMPGSTHGNWEWRLAPGQLTPEIASLLRTLTTCSGRA